jgi:hypothetical protein
MQPSYVSLQQATQEWVEIQQEVISSAFGINLI